MTASQLQALITRMATDTEFALAVKTRPDDIASEYGISASDLTVLAALKVDTGVRPPTRLEERLSRAEILAPRTF